MQMSLRQRRVLARIPSGLSADLPARMDVLSGLGFGQVCFEVAVQNAILRQRECQVGNEPMMAFRISIAPLYRTQTEHCVLHFLILERASVCGIRFNMRLQPSLQILAVQRLRRRDREKECCSGWRLRRLIDPIRPLLSKRPTRRCINLLSGGK